MWPEGTAGPRFGLGALAADLNNDGWPDIYLACDQTPSLLYENRRNGTFAEREEEVGVALNANGQPQEGKGIAVGDFDGNGRLDIAKTNFSGDLPSLYRNEDGAVYHDAAETAGLGEHKLLDWGVAFVDVDDDGWPDLFMANGHVYPEVERAKLGDQYAQPVLLFRNLGNSRFADLSRRAGAALTVPRPSRGLAIGDLTGDGRPELVITNMDTGPRVLTARRPGGRFLNVLLRGTRGNRSAIGARATAEAGGLKHIADAMDGASYYSAHAPELHFGLGAASHAKVTVRWPGGNVEQWEALPANSLCVVTEGRAGAECSHYETSPATGGAAAAASGPDHKSPGV